jgi:hypothetical protein
MKKLLILLAVATLPFASGCACARLCPCCPCNWFNRPATYCAPACPPTYAAPLAATCAPYSPCAPVATAAPYMPAMAQPFMPQCATCPNAPVMAQAQPMYYQAPMANPCGACYAEPGCAYAGGYAGEVGCGCSGPAMVGYGGDCGSCGSCGSCDSCGSCGSGGCSSCSGGAPAATSPTPAPERFQDPGPGGA